MPTIDFDINSYVIAAKIQPGATYEYSMGGLFDSKCERCWCLIFHIKLSASG